MPNNNADVEADVSVPPTSGDVAFDTILSRYWNAIRSKRRGMRILDTVNVRLVDAAVGAAIELGESDAEQRLRYAWRQLTTRAKVNCSFGMVLEHKTTKEQKYYHSSSNNATYEPNPTLVKTEEELVNYLLRISQSDISGTLTMMRPNTEWKLRAVTNVTFYIFKMIAMGKVGASVRLPKRLLDSKAVLCMDKNYKTGKPFKDNLCFFRNMKEEELSEISKCISLKDLAVGTVIEILTITEQTSKFGIYGMATYEFATINENVLQRGRLILPKRFVDNIEPEGGLPAVYVYYGKVASTLKKGTEYHDLRRAPVDPTRPYGPSFTTSHHAQNLRERPIGELRTQLFTYNLSEISAGSTLILHDLKYVKTLKSARAPTVAFILSVDETEVEEGDVETVGRLYLPPRFVSEFRDNQPRVTRYAGLKKGSGSRTYHDLIFSPLVIQEKECIGGCANPKLLESNKSTKRGLKRTSTKPSPKPDMEVSPLQNKDLMTNKSNVKAKTERLCTRIVVDSDGNFAIADGSNQKEQSMADPRLTSKPIHPPPIIISSDEEDSDIVEITPIKVDNATITVDQSRHEHRFKSKELVSPPSSTLDDAALFDGDKMCPSKRKKLSSSLKLPVLTEDQIKVEANDFAAELLAFETDAMTLNFAQKDKNVASAPSVPSTPRKRSSHTLKPIAKARRTLGPPLLSAALRDIPLPQDENSNHDNNNILSTDIFDQEAFDILESQFY